VPLTVTVTPCNDSLPALPETVPESVWDCEYKEVRKEKETNRTVQIFFMMVDFGYLPTLFQVFGRSCGFLLGNRSS
jgi:hypothetical protein